MKRSAPYRLVLTLKILIFLLLLCFSGLAFFAWANTHEAFLQYLVERFGLYERRQLLSALISEEKYLLIRLLMSGAALLMLVLFLLSGRIARFLEPFFASVRQSWKGLIQEMYLLWNKLPRLAKITTLLFFSILILYRLGCIFYFPFLTDEVYSYLFLVDRGAPVIVSNYHGPNSHILYLLAAWLFDLFLPPEAAMRAPSFLAGLLLPVLIFLTLLKRWGFLAALFATVVFSFSFHITYYSVTGRGHIFFLFFFFVALVSALRIREKSDRAAFFVFGAANVCAAYTLLSWIFPMASLLLFLLVSLRKEPGKIRSLLFTLFLVFSVLLLLYLPVFLISGPESITGNWWVKSFTFPPGEFFRRFPSYLATVTEYLWETGSPQAWIITILTFLLAAGVLYLERQYAILLLLLSLLLMPFLILPIRGLLLPEKTWLYFILLKSFCLALILSWVRKKIGNLPVRQLLAATAFLLALVFSGKRMYEHRFGFYFRLQDFLSWMRDHEPGKILAAEDTYYLYLRYQFEVERETRLTLHMNPEAGMEYEFIIQPVEQALPENTGKIVYRNKDVVVYGRQEEGN